MYISDPLTNPDSVEQCAVVAAAGSTSLRLEFTVKKNSSALSSAR
jgi:hypothetical protein